MSRSTPSRSSGRSGDDATSAGWTVTGRRFANRPEPAAQREQRLLRPDRGRRIGPLRPADGAEQDRIGRAARLDVLGPDRDAVRVDGDAPGEDLGPVDREPEPPPGRVDDPAGGLDDLGPDPVARDRGDRGTC